MFKKLIIFSTIAVLGGCETINQTKQCDPTKNYLISNPESMEEYKSLRKNGEIRSYYIKTTPTKHCNTNICVIYNNNKFDFIEKLFNNQERKGIYTIKAYENFEGRDCMIENAATKKKSPKYCYEAIKNENEIIKSRYHYITNSNKGITNITVLDSINNKNLYEYSYQTYSNHAMGGPGFGICEVKNNNPNYKFNPVTFIIDN